MKEKTYTLLALGPSDASSDEKWLQGRLVSHVIRNESASVTGKRFGSRALGIGLDSLLLAMKTLRRGDGEPYLANNPWIGAALRVTGRRKFVVTGVYAEPNSRSWKLLRCLVGDVPVVTLSRSEAVPWNESGGHAQAVLYGNSFGYPRKSIQGSSLSIFVGGTSDRDLSIVRKLEEEVLESEEPVLLTLATGEPAGERVRGSNAVRRPGPLDQRAFGELMSRASVLFLPLKDGTRAAGHMVLVGAMEIGIPTAITPNRGISEYIIGPGISECDTSLPILPQLAAIAALGRGNDDAIRKCWKEMFSLEAYILRVEDSIMQMCQSRTL